MKVLNISLKPASPSQIEAGMVPVYAHKRDELRELLTFDAPPTPRMYRERADKLVALANGHIADAVHLDVPPYFQGFLEQAFWETLRPIKYSYEQAGKHVCWIGLGGPEQ